MPASQPDKEMTKEILIAYISHSTSAAAALFNTALKPEVQIEALWERILKTVSEK
jgi:hypothetical protein